MSKREVVGQPWVKKFWEYPSGGGKPRWEVLQQVSVDGKLIVETVETFNDPHDGEMHAMNWIRHHTQLWSPRR